MSVCLLSQSPQESLLQSVLLSESSRQRLRDSPPKHTYAESHTHEPSPTATSPPTRPKTTALHSPANVNLTMTPPKSPYYPPLGTSDTKQPGDLHVSVSEQAGESYEFSPPAVIRTPQTSEVIARSKERSPGGQTSEETNFLFSLPLTRAMMKRYSLDVSVLGNTSASRDMLNVSITGRSLRPRSHTGRCTPHQSPSDSPISFLSPAPSQTTSPKSTRRRSVTKKLVPKPLHRMTLRARQCPGRTTRSAKLPHAQLP